MVSLSLDVSYRIFAAAAQKEREPLEAAEQAAWVRTLHSRRSTTRTARDATRTFGVTPSSALASRSTRLSPSSPLAWAQLARTLSGPMARSQGRWWVDRAATSSRQWAASTMTTRSNARPASCRRRLSPTPSRSLVRGTRTHTRPALPATIPCNASLPRVVFLLAHHAPIPRRATFVDYTTMSQCVQNAFTGSGVQMPGYGNNIAGYQGFKSRCPPTDKGDVGWAKVSGSAL